MSGIVFGRGVTVGGVDSRKMKCTTCGRTGGEWSKTVTDGRTVWRHECGAEQ